MSSNLISAVEKSLKPEES